MLQRNWIDLSRKLVDRFDLDFTLGGMSQVLGKYALTFFGEGVKITTTFPDPFPIGLSVITMTGTAGPGIAYDALGNFTSIPSGLGVFNIPPSSLFARWDLLVIRYKQTGDTLIPKPSDPLTMINLNLHDDYELSIIEGSGAFYPAKNPNDIILAGIQVPIGATIGSMCSVDLSIRELGYADVAKYPVLKQELLTGIIDGSNKTFTTSLTPVANSILITEDGLTDSVSSDFSIVGNTVTFVDAPAPGKELYAWYIVLDPSSTNPMAATQETPVGVIDGTNDTFALAGKPANKDSTIPFVNGQVVTSDQWSLIQTPTGSFIKFTPGNIPKKAQSLYCFYFVNPATVGVAHGGGGGGGGGAYVVNGSEGAPILVDPLIGIISTPDQRSIQFISASLPADIVTANPQISPGSIIGQELTLCGTSDTNYPVFNDGNGLDIDGTVNLTANEVLPLFWTGTKWKEIARRL